MWDSWHQYAKYFPNLSQSVISSTEGLLGMKMSSCFLAFVSIQVPTASMQYLISFKVGVILEVPNRNTIHWISQYPVRTSTDPGQPFMLINSVNALTYLLRFLRWSLSRFLYHIMSIGSAAMTMSNFGKWSVSTKQKLVRFTHPKLVFTYTSFKCQIKWRVVRPET